MESYPSGLRGRLGKALDVETRAWVRIPCFPYVDKMTYHKKFKPSFRGLSFFFEWQSFAIQVIPKKYQEITSQNASAI